MTGSDRRKQSLYFPEDMLDEMRFHSTRLNRSLSWVVQKAWKVARSQVMAMPSANDQPGPMATTNVTPSDRSADSGNR